MGKGGKIYMHLNAEDLIGKIKFNFLLAREIYKFIDKGFKLLYGQKKKMI